MTNENQQTEKENAEHSEEQVSSQEESSPVESIESENTTEVEECGLKDPIRRVKLYHLSDSGQWLDKGTGHVHCSKDDEQSYITFISEVNDETLLKSAISTDDIYQLQSPTLIVWNEPQAKFDMALSFQHMNGCLMIWDQIRKVQGRKPDGKEIVERIQQGEDDEELADITDDVDDDLVNVGLNGSTISIGSTGSNTPKIELPDPSIKTLPTILSLISEHRFRLARFIKHDYIEKLFEVFRECEDIDSVQDCRILFRIFSNIISMDDTEILDILFSNENIMQLIGVLEYDPDLPTKKANHRNYLKNVVVFKEVIPFNNHLILDKIHQTFRIQYIKETILASIIDDQTFSTLSNIILRNNSAIINAIKEDQEFMRKVFSSLMSNDISPEKQRDLAKFLGEFNCLLKQQIVYTRLEIYKKLLTEYSLLDVIEKYLQNDNVNIRHIYSEILLSMAQTIHISLLTEIKQKHNNKDFNFLKVVIRTIVSETEMGIQDNLTEVIKLLLDPETLMSNSDNFLEQFYTHHIEIIASPITSPSTTIQMLKKPTVKASCINHALDLLSFTVIHHKLRSKTFLMSHDVIPKALHLLDTHREKDLILAVIRFFKSIISRGDLFLNNCILTNNLFAPVMNVWRKNANSYNLINSAIIDLFETLRTTASTSRLKRSCVDQFRADFEKVNYVETFKQLLEEQDQQDQQDRVENENQGENEEESYFYESSSDTEDNHKRSLAHESPERASTEEEDEFFMSFTHKNDEEDENDVYSFNNNNKQGGDSTNTTVTSYHSPQKLQISLKPNPTSPTKGEVEPNPKKRK